MAYTCEVLVKAVMPMFMKSYMPCYKILLDTNERLLRQQLHLLRILFERHCRTETSLWYQLKQMLLSWSCHPPLTCSDSGQHWNFRPYTSLWYTHPAHLWMHWDLPAHWPCKPLQKETNIVINRVPHKQHWNLPSYISHWLIHPDYLKGIKITDFYTYKQH